MPKKKSKPTLSKLKSANKLYFQKGNDRMFGVRERKILRSPKDKFYMLEKHVQSFGGKMLTKYTVRPIKSRNVIGIPVGGFSGFSTKSKAISYINKH